MTNPYERLREIRNERIPESANEITCTYCTGFCYCDEPKYSEVTLQEIIVMLGTGYLVASDGSLCFGCWGKHNYTGIKIDLLKDPKDQDPEVLEQIIKLLE